MSELGVTTNLSSGVATFGVGEGVEGAAVVGAGGVDGLLVHGEVVCGHGEAVDVGLFGDGAGVLGEEAFCVALSLDLLLQPTAARTAGGEVLWEGRMLAERTSVPSLPLPV